MPFSFSPTIVAALLLGALLYRRATRVLARRGRRTPKAQQAAWFGGLGLMAVAFMGPPGVESEHLLAWHMAQHLLIADLAAPLLIVGIRTPVLVFLPPRPLLVGVARRRRLRSVLRVLRLPPVAIGVYLVVLYGWHLRGAFEGAAANPALHVVQHQSFVAISLLVWWSALQPERARMPGGLWKMGHICAARLVSVFLGMALLFGGSAFYADTYAAGAARHALTPLQDQQIAGGMMMTLDVVIMMFAVALFFWRSAADFDRSQQRLSVPAGAPGGAQNLRRPPRA